MTGWRRECCLTTELKAARPVRVLPWRAGPGVQSVMETPGRWALRPAQQPSQSVLMLPSFTFLRLWFSNIW